MALTIFAAFTVAFISSQTSNINDSSMLEEEMTISRLCENKINEIYLSPPEFRESLTISKETKNFEEEENKDYEYTIEYKRFKIPDFSKITGQGENAKSSGMQAMVFQKMQKNLQEMIWQVSVTVRNKTTDYKYTLSTWIDNSQAKVNFN